MRRTQSTSLKQELKRRAAETDLPTKYLAAETVSGMGFEARSKLGCQISGLSRMARRKRHAVSRHPLNPTSLETLTIPSDYILSSNNECMMPKNKLSCSELNKPNEPVFSSEALSRVVRNVRVVKEADRSRNVVIFGLHEKDNEKLNERLRELRNSLRALQKTESRGMQGWTKKEYKGLSSRGQGQTFKFFDCRPAIGQREESA
ncbi:hypothetical protein ACHWQZ_G001497 [Mnemiopsis leidyi]